MVDEPSIPGHGYCSGLVVDSMATGWEVPPNPTEEAGSTKTPHSINTQKTNNSTKIISTSSFDSIFGTHLLPCCANVKDMKPLRRSMQRVGRWESRSRFSKMHTFVYGADSKHRKHRTPKIGKPNIPKQSRCHLFYETKSSAGSQMLRLLTHGPCFQIPPGVQQDLATDWYRARGLSCNMDRNLGWKKSGSWKISDGMIRWLMWLWNLAV